MLFNLNIDGKKWNSVITIAENDAFFINGINIWDFEWEFTGERIHFSDPLRDKNYTFQVYKIITSNLEIEFGAGEFSNCVWGIYQKI